MKLLINKTFKTFILLFSVCFCVEIIFKLAIGNAVFDWSTLRIFFGIIVLSSIFAILFSYIKKGISNFLTILICVIATIYAIAQAGFYNYLGTYMSVSTSSQAGAVMDFIAEFIGSFKWYYYLILIPLVLLIVFYIIMEKKLSIHEKNLEINYLDKIRGKKKKDEYLEKYKLRLKKRDRFSRLIFLGLCLISSFLYYLSLNVKFMQNDIQIVSNKELFRNPSIPNIAVSQFGVLGYGIIDVKSLILPSNSVSDELVFSNNDNKSNTEVTDYSRVIDDSDWISLNESEVDKDYKTLNSYFMSKNITEKNEYTGILKDKNLIVIMIETGSNVLINYPEYFPNFAKIYNNGWSFVNAFSPRNACSTGNNEMTGITSLHTINQNCTANVYKDNTYYESIFNLFNKEGYYTSSYHDYTDQFYYRSIFHPNMGSQKFYNVNDLGMKFLTNDDPVCGSQPWPSDEEFIEKALPKFVGEEKFMSWMTTVSAHMKYYCSSVTGDMYLDLFKDEKWNIQAKRYMSKLKIVDEAFGKLLNMLEEAGKLDDTVLMIYADHEPYGLDSTYFQQIAKYDISSNGDIDRTPFIIYNSELTPAKYEQYTSFINIVPTIANLFDLDYDPRVYGGTDLFSDSYQNYVVFADGSWRSDIAYYDATTGKMNYLGDKTYTSEEIQKINTTIKNEMSMDNLAIKTDYFTYLNKKLNKGFVVGTANNNIKLEFKKREEIESSKVEAVVEDNDEDDNNVEGE